MSLLNSSLSELLLLFITREFFFLINDEINDQSTFLTNRHFRVHPKTQELLPELDGMALADMPSNPFFVQLSETYVVLAMNEIIDNLDNAGVLSKLLECLHPEWYVTYVPIDAQNDVSFIHYSILASVRFRCTFS